MTIQIPDSPVGDELVAGLKAQRVAFEEKFGRPPGPTDPIFFDPDADTPQMMSMVSVESAMVGAMQTAGISDEYIYAYQHTGLMLTEDNYELMSDEDLAAWDAAIESYRALHGSP